MGADFVAASAHKFGGPRGVDFAPPSGFDVGESTTVAVNKTIVVPVLKMWLGQRHWLLR